MHLGLACCAPGPCPLLVLGELGFTHLVRSLGQPSLHDGLRLAAAPSCSHHYLGYMPPDLILPLFSLLV